MLGNAIAIHCLAEGYPEPSVTWLKSHGKSWAHLNKYTVDLIGLICAIDKTTKEFKSMPLRNSSLLVDFATEADEGYYMCQVSNGIGTELKKIIYINVNGKLSIYPIRLCIPNTLTMFITYIRASPLRECNGQYFIETERRSDVELRCQRR